MQLATEDVAGRDSWTVTGQGKTKTAAWLFMNAELTSVGIQSHQIYAIKNQKQTYSLGFRVSDGHSSPRSIADWRGESARVKTREKEKTR